MQDLRKIVPILLARESLVRSRETSRGRLKATALQTLPPLTLNAFDTFRCKTFQFAFKVSLSTRLSIFVENENVSLKTFSLAMNFEPFRRYFVQKDVK